MSSPDGPPDDGAGSTETGTSSPQDDQASRTEVVYSLPRVTVSPPLTIQERRRIFRREVVRLWIVLLLFLAFLITLVWSFISANGPYWGNVKDLLDLIFPAETALLGTAIAFYMTDVRGSDDSDGSNTEHISAKRRSTE
jgi:hypothetical protein